MAAKKKASTARAAPQKSKKKSRAGRIVAVILLTVLLAAVGCGIYYAIETNGFTRFEYLEYNGRRLGTAERGVKLDRGKNVFEIKSMKPAGGAGKYTVKIQANSEAKFTFQADGNPQSFAHVGDVTEYFGIEISEDRFEVNIPRIIRFRQCCRKSTAAKRSRCPMNCRKTRTSGSCPSGCRTGKTYLYTSVYLTSRRSA